MSWLFAEMFTLMSQHLLGLCLPGEVKCDIAEGISGSHHTGTASESERDGSSYNPELYPRQVNTDHSLISKQEIEHW